MITYNTLEEALLAGAKFAHVGDNGEYVEYLTYENGFYYIKRWVYGQCIMTKEFDSIDSVLKNRKYSHWENQQVGEIKQHCSLDEISEILKGVVDIHDELPYNIGYHVVFFKDNDDNSYYELAINKHFVTPNRYYIEASNVRRFGFSSSIFGRAAEDDSLYLKYCSELIEVLKKLKLDEGWYKINVVEIKKKVAS